MHQACVCAPSLAEHVPFRLAGRHRAAVVQSRAEQGPALLTSHASPIDHTPFLRGAVAAARRIVLVMYLPCAPSGAPCRDLSEGVPCTPVAFLPVFLSNDV